MPIFRVLVNGWDEIACFFTMEDATDWIFSEGCDVFWRTARHMRVVPDVV